MKKLINSIFVFFGAKPYFKITNFNKAKGNYADLITIEQQAIDFVDNTLSLVNEALRSELQRNGYDLNAVRRGEIIVNSTATTSQRDKRFKSQVYSVDGFVVLRLNWKPNGFTLETNAAAIATQRKKDLKANLARTYDEKLIKDRETNEVEVEALANKKMQEIKAVK